jgi:hypothetical protein
VSQFNVTLAASVKNISDFNIPIGDSFLHMINRDGKLVRDDPARFNACVVVGEPSSWAALRHEVNHLGESAQPYCEEPLIIIVTPDRPLSQYAARNPIEYLAAAVESDPIDYPHSITNQDLLERHLQFAAGEIPLKLGDVKDRFDELGEDALIALEVGGRIKKIKKMTWDLKQKQPMDVTLYEPVEGTTLPPCDLDIIGNSPWAVATRETPEDILMLLDDYQVCQFAYPHAKLVHEGKRYMVRRLVQENRRIEFVSDNQPGFTEPIHSLTFSNVKDPEGISVYEHWFSKKKTSSLFIQAMQLRVGISVDGLHTFPNFDLAEGKPELYREELNRTDVSTEFETKGFVFSFSDEGGQKVYHTLLHLFQEVLPLFLGEINKGVGLAVFSDVAGIEKKQGLIIYDKVPNGNGISSWIEKHLDHILAQCYRVLVQCPCTGGCPGCIQIPGCQYEEANSDLDKIASIRVLGKYLEEPYQETIKYRTKKVDSVEAMDYYRWLIVDHILPNHFKLTIGSPAELRIEIDPKKIPANIAGYYLPARNLVLCKPYNLQEMISLMSHEYAHNWQFQGKPLRMHPSLMDEANVPYFDGKLFLEGFAQWIEFKLADCLGFRETVEGIIFAHCTEYREGFLVLKWLEDQPEGGAYAVIHFITTGECLLGENQLTIDELILNSKMRQRIIDAVARYKEDPFTSDISLDDGEQETEPVTEDSSSEDEGDKGEQTEESQNEEDTV